jgi:hypothetical protein
MTFGKTAAFCLSLCLAGRAYAQQPGEHGTSISDPGNSFEVLMAKVEQVFSYADEAGFQFIAYQISYQGHPVVVEDPIGSTNIAVGGEVRFLVIRHDMTKAPRPGKKLLSFLVTKQVA